MREWTVRQRLKMSKKLEALYDAMDKCGCGREVKPNNIKNDKEVTNAISGMNQEKNSNDTAVNTSVNVVVVTNSSTTAAVPRTLATSIRMAPSNSRVTKHDHGHTHDHDQKTAEVDKDDHEYVHSRDVLHQLPPLHTTESSSDSEIQMEHREVQVEVDGNAASEKDERDERKKMSDIKKCEKCKHRAELAQRLEAVMVDMNESAQVMDDYIVQCAHQIDDLEQSRKEWKGKGKKRKCASGRSGQEEGEGCTVGQQVDRRVNAE